MRSELEPSAEAMAKSMLWWSRFSFSSARVSRVNEMVPSP